VKEMLFTVLLVIILLAILAWIGYFSITIINYYRIPRLSKTSYEPLKNSPVVSVIIPTRNEAFRIEPCIKSLKSQIYPNLEILIIDDSTDNTVDVIRKIVGNDARFRIIKQDKLPEGWVGKPHALQQGSTLAKGEWLVFIDADTSHEPELISQVVSYAVDKKVDFVSLVPKHICKTFWEKVIQPIPLSIIPVLSPMAKVNKQDSKAAVAFGPFIMIKRDVFEKIGGYETIKSRIADDAEIAKLVKTAGFKMNLVNAQSLMDVRMYESFHDIWEGWGKNIFLGIVQKRKMKKKGVQILFLIFGSTGVFGVMIFPFIMFLISAFAFMVTENFQWERILIFSTFLWVISIFLQFGIQKRYKIGDAKYSILAFVGGLVTIGIFLSSARQTISESGVKWKGRTYSSKGS